MWSSEYHTDSAEFPLYCVPSTDSAVFCCALCCLTNVSATKIGKTSVASAQTLTLLAFALIFPQLTASSIKESD